MGSTLRYSAIDESGVEREAGELDELDAEVASLQGQIDDARTALTAIQTNIEDTKEQHAKQVVDLSQQIADAKATAADSLQRQELAHQAELAKLAKDFDDRVGTLKAMLNRNIEQNAEFQNIRRELSTLGKQTKLTDLRRVTERHRSKIQERQSKTELSALQNELKKREILNTAILAVRRLEGEISDLQASRRENSAEARLKITDLLTQVDLRRADQATFIQALQRDFTDRGEHFEGRIEMLQRQIDQERTQNEFEIRSAAEKCENLQRMYQAVSRRGNQQLSQLDADMRQLRRAIEMAEQGEQRFATGNREQMARLRTLQSETDTLRRTGVTLEKELADTQSGNATAASVLRQSDRSAERVQRRNAVFP
jgi:chromosome segregation ATPase